VTDNGAGMDREDAEKSLQRHATSKLRRSEDLEEIRTLGFRGEALPSIASVALFRLVTRTGDQDEGTEILVEGGDLRHIRTAGGPVGTDVEVRSLFSHVPARRKFLKTDSTEWGHIEAILQRAALFHYGVHWEWRHNGGEWRRYPACDSSDERLFQIFSPEWRDGTLSLSARAGRDGQWRLSGRVSLPSLVRKNRREQYWFVNGRPVVHPGLSYALREAYGVRMARELHPVAVLFLDCPGADVDVNVHPAKREIRLRNENGIRRFLIESVGDRLRERDRAARPGTASTSAATQEGEGTFTPDPPDRDEAEVPVVAPRPTLRTPAPRASQVEWTIGGHRSDDSSPVEEGEKGGDDSPAAIKEERSETAPPFKIVGSTEPGLILGESDDGLILVHVVAAFERIYYEECLERFVNEQVESQQLLVPVTLDVDPETAAFLNDSSHIFEKSGISIGPVGGASFMVDALPPAASGRDPVQFLRGLIDTLQRGENTPAKLRTIEDQAFAAALARQLSRGRRVETIGEMNWLVDRLHACDLPYSRPDGRPTMTLLSRQEFKRRFKVDG
jgi:DNA mismatch repair protein MutL